MRELEDGLIEEEGALHAAAAALAELDAALALASVAADFGFVRPEVTVTSRFHRRRRLKIIDRITTKQSLQDLALELGGKTC